MLRTLLLCKENFITLKKACACFLVRSINLTQGGAMSILLTSGARSTCRIKLSIHSLQSLQRQTFSYFRGKLSCQHLSGFIELLFFMLDMPGQAVCPDTHLTLTHAPERVHALVCDTSGPASVVLFVLEATTSTTLGTFTALCTKETSRENPNRWCRNTMGNKERQNWAYDECTSKALIL